MASQDGHQLATFHGHAYMPEEGALIDNGYIYTTSILMHAHMCWRGRACINALNSLLLTDDAALLSSASATSNSETQMCILATRAVQSKVGLVDHMM